MDVCGVNFALDHVQDGNVAALLAGNSRDHAILGLEESAHDVEHCSLSHSLGLFDLIACEGGVGCHEEVASRSWDEGGEDADEIVVHVAWISESRGASRHDGSNLFMLATAFS